MSNEELIKAWKYNEKPFLYVGNSQNERTAMQSLAWQITYGKDFIDLEDEWGRHYNNEHQFENHLTYRLPFDYKVEPETVECNIWLDTDCLVYDRNNSVLKIAIEEALSDPDFTGFKYEGILFGRLYKCKSTGQCKTMINFDDLDKYEVCDMTKASALFRGSK